MLIINKKLENFLNLAVLQEENFKTKIEYEMKYKAKLII